MKNFFCFILGITIVTGLVGFRSVSATPSAHLVISEIQTTGGTGYTTDEFVELYNPTETDVGLAGWKLTKKTAAGKEYVLVDNFGEKSIKSHSFFLITHPSGYAGQTAPDLYYTTTNSISDNNTVILYDGAGQIVDKIGFGSTTDFEGETLGNPSGKKSVERKAKAESTVETMAEGGSDYFLGNAEDTDNNKNDFITRDNPEPQNSSSEPEYLTYKVPDAPQTPTDNGETKTDEQKNEETAAYSNKIIISEFFPNPAGSDDGEFIELKNIGDTDIDLNGWKLGDNSLRKYIMQSVIIKAGEFLSIDKKVSGVSLNNNGDAVKLYQPDDNLLAKVEYKTCQEGQSYNLINGQWVWSDEVTPGKENILKIKNELPEADMNFPKEAKVRMEIVFDASESSDADNDKLQYFWDFGDGKTSQEKETKHSFQKAGNYMVSLKVTDTKAGEDKIASQIKISDYDYSTKIVINELLPAPAGDDKELEWVELFNPEKRDINLGGWQLTDIKTYYQFPADKIIKANNYLVIKRKESKIVLNDSGDKLFLIDPNKKIINGVEYQSAKNDLAFARLDNHWTWTEKPTPDKKNEFIITEAEGDSGASETSQDVAVTENVINETPIELKISQVNENYLKKLLTITGDIERISGLNIYLTDVEGNGLRVYIQNKTGIKKPELKQGDSLTVTGILDKTEAGLRLLPRKQEDIVLAQKVEAGQVLGAATEKQDVAVPTDNKSQPVKIYLLVTAIALAVILAGLFLRNYFVKRKQL